MAGSSNFPRTLAIVMLALVAAFVAVVALDERGTSETVGAPSSAVVAGTVIAAAPSGSGAGGAVVDGNAPVLQAAAPSDPSPAPEAPSSTVPAANADDIITVAIGGDVHGEPPIKQVMDRGGSPLEFAAPILSAADVAVVNLETAIGPLGKPADKKYTFRSDDRLLASLNNAGVDVVSVANNHAYDFGRDAFLDTLTRVRANGMEPTGGGNNAAEAYAPTIVDVRGTKVAIVGLAKVGPGDSGRATATRPGTTNARDLTASVNAIKAAKQQAPIVIVFLHWGVELDRCPQPEDKRLAQSLLDAGASAVVGAHPHVLQGISLPPGKLIAYSIGNFVFYATRPVARDSMVLTISFRPDGTVSAHNVTTMRIDKEGRPRPTDAATGQRIINEINNFTPDGPGPC
jgi:poly-gamma-glutamate capsule biosynthesis protein CapA/YwtB (metallophosphatase superfamily)